MASFHTTALVWVFFFLLFSKRVQHMLPLMWSHKQQKIKPTRICLVPSAIKLLRLVDTGSNRAPNQTCTKEIFLHTGRYFWFTRLRVVFSCYKCIPLISCSRRSRSSDTTSHNWRVKRSVLQRSKTFSETSLSKRSLGTWLCVWPSLSRGSRQNDRRNFPFLWINTVSVNRWRAITAT